MDLPDIKCDFSFLKVEVSDKMSTTSTMAGSMEPIEVDSPTISRKSLAWSHNNDEIVDCESESDDEEEEVDEADLVPEYDLRGNYQSTTTNKASMLGKRTRGESGQSIVQCHGANKRARVSKTDDTDLEDLDFFAHDGNDDLELLNIARMNTEDLRLARADAQIFMPIRNKCLFI